MELTYYLNDVSNSLTQVMMTYGEEGNFDAAYTYGLERISVEAVDGTRPESQDPLYYLYDGLGSVKYLIKPDGNKRDHYRYDEFGKPSPGNSKLSQDGKNVLHNAFGYTGEMWDQEAELLYLRARYYEPETGRFLSRDSYWGNMRNPLSRNLYSYVQNNPVNYVDPTGRWTSNQGFNVQKSTHQWLVYRGLDIIEKAGYKSYTDEIWNNNSFISSLIQGVNHADQDDAPYHGHFYNPETGKNYLYVYPELKAALEWWYEKELNENDTALSRLNKYFTLATDNYKNKSKSIGFYYLGYALHYLQDLGNAYHTSDLIAIFTTHSEYEEYVDKLKNGDVDGYDQNKLVVSNVEIDLKALQSVSELGERLADFSHSYGEGIEEKDEAGWQDSIYYTLRRTELDSAKLILMFFEEAKG